ncbi:MAG: hypothetical protein ACI81L_003122 [Verrucomicrobiales bacterium]|jgi:hypothetical protein
MRITKNSTWGNSISWGKKGVTLSGDALYDVDESR